MEKIEGLNLEESLKLVQDDILSEKKREINTVIRGIYRDIENWTKLKKKSEEEMKKWAEKIEKAFAGIERVKLNDWNYINSLLNKNQEQKSEA